MKTHNDPNPSRRLRPLAVVNFFLLAQQVAEQLNPLTCKSPEGKWAAARIDPEDAQRPAERCGLVDLVRTPCPPIPGLVLRFTNSRTWAKRGRVQVQWLGVRNPPASAAVMGGAGQDPVITITEEADARKIAEEIRRRLLPSVEKFNEQAHQLIAEQATAATRERDFTREIAELIGREEAAPTMSLAHLIEHCDVYGDVTIRGERADFFLRGLCAAHARSLAVWVRDNLRGRPVSEERGQLATMTPPQLIDLVLQLRGAIGRS